MSIAKFKKGDEILVTTGKDKGKKGKIERVFLGEHKALIDGVNIYKKHVKPEATNDKKGGIHEIPRPLDFAKIAVVCPACKKQTRMGFKIQKGVKTRICRKCGKKLDK